MRYSDLASRRKSLTVEVPGVGPLTVEYDPGFYTTRYEAKRAAIQNVEGNPTQSTADILKDILRGWDMTQDIIDTDGNPVLDSDGNTAQEPAPLERLYDLDLHTLGLILQACITDVFPNETRASS